MSLSPSSRGGGGGGYCFTVRNRNTYYSVFNRELITREWSRKHGIGVIRERASRISLSLSGPPSHVTKPASSSSDLFSMVVHGCLGCLATPVTILLYSTPYKKTSNHRVGREERGRRRSAAMVLRSSSSSSPPPLTLTLLS